MFKFINNDDADKLDAALAKGGKIGELNKKGESLLMACVDSGAQACMKTLLSKGVDLDVKDKAGDTVLIRAIKSGEAASVELLLQHKPRCALTSVDAAGLTPLHWAVKLSDLAAMDLLLELHEGKELLTKADKEGGAPVFVAISSACSEDALLRLLQAGKQQLELVEKKKGRTPLLAAAACGNAEALAHLIKLGANLDALDNDSRNLLHCAVEFGELPLGVDLARFLFSPDAQGDTPLHVAARAGNQRMFAELKKLGADETKANLAGKTALQLFKEAGRQSKKGKAKNQSFLLTCFFFAQVQQDEAEMEQLVQEEAKKLAEKAAAARAAAAAKSKTAERAFEAASQRTAEKYAERNAKRRARAAERAAQGLEPEEEEEDEDEEAGAEEKNEPAKKKEELSKPKSGKRPDPAAAAAVAKPIEIGGRSSIVWMLVICVLFLGVFVLSKIWAKQNKKI